MCLWFDSCFGRSVKEDYGPAAAADAKARPMTYHRPAWNGADHSQQRNGNHGAARDGHGYTAYAQDKAYTYSAVDETLKLPARNSKVGDDTGYKAGFYEPAHKEDTTGYHYPTTTATIARCY